MESKSQEPRRLIRFGNSSYIISLPKDWIKKHKLKKGDLIYTSVNEQGELIVTPQSSTNIRSNKSISINIDSKNLLEMQRELTSAYINNFSEMIFIGKTLNSKKETIKKIISEKTGIEISEESSEKIVVRDIFDFDSVSLERVMRRMDNIIRSMFEEILIGLKGPVFKEWYLKELYKSDQGANKVYFLLMKLIRKSQEDVGFMYKAKLDSKKLADTSWFALHSESLGDEIKRTAKFLRQANLSDEDRENLLNMLSRLEKDYINSMNAFYSGDKKMAQEVANHSRDDNLSAIEKFFEKSGNEMKGNIAEKVKGIISAVHNISKITAY